MVTNERNIRIQNLCVHFPTTHGYVKAVDNISTVFEQGQITAIIGESGCGKSVLGQAILSMLPEYVHISGQVLCGDIEILDISTAKRQQLYRQIFGLVPQNPGESLSPMRKIQKQMQDILLLRGSTDSNNQQKSYLLDFFGLQDIPRVLNAYPHELSGGMQQRVLCAMGISNQPEWLLADEPTKGLDEKVCQVVYDNLLKIKQTNNCSMLIITHDITLARLVCDQVAMMYGGQILEQGTEIFTKPQHPYTKAFMAALPENGFQPVPDAPNGEELVDTGCKFAPRCQQCMPHCRTHTPQMYVTAGGKVRCWLYA